MEAPGKEYKNRLRRLGYTNHEIYDILMGDKELREEDKEFEWNTVKPEGYTPWDWFMILVRGLVFLPALLVLGLTAVFFKMLGVKDVTERIALTFGMFVVDVGKFWLYD